jgi:hypothetical protein
MAVVRIQLYLYLYLYLYLVQHILNAHLNRSLLDF